VADAGPQADAAWIVRVNPRRFGHSSPAHSPREATPSQLADDVEEHTRTQHAACAGWPPECRVHTTGRTVEESLALVRRASGT
jgi:hypothetical protein